MLFKISVNKTISSRTLFGIKTKNSEYEYLFSVESEQQLIEHFDDLPKEGVEIWTNIYGDDRRLWKTERTWEKVDGDDKDAHILLLKSPTDVLYIKRIRYI